MEPDRLRALLGADVHQHRDEHDLTPPGVFPSLVTSDFGSEALPRPLIQAAVLVGITYGSKPGVVLTKRTSTLTKHAGQVAFPGGRMDPGETAEQTALREAFEEVGLMPDSVEVTGRLPDYTTGTNYLITPVLGLLKPGFIPNLAVAEVASLFELPLRVLLDPAAPYRQQAEFQGKMREFWVWPHAEHHIWGATAAILVHLAHRLRETGVV